MANKKNFIIDTNVILHDYSFIENFEENDIYIPFVVLEELDKFKKGNEEMISISSLPFSYPLSTPLFHAQCFIHRIFRGLIEHQGETAYKFRRYRGKIGGAGNGEDDFSGAAV